MSAHLPSVLIVGAGEFGASTAVSLLRSGRYSKVTIIERSNVIPAPDAASFDLNKIVRFDYSDMDYCRLARRAIDEWNKEEWKGIYHQSGTLVLGVENEPTDGKETARQVLDNVRSMEPNITVLDSPDTIRPRLAPHPSIPTALPPQSKGYHNPTAGWANATKAVEKLHEMIGNLGGLIIPGAAMKELITDVNDGDVKGVRCEDGRKFFADKVIIATGSWTPTIIGSLLTQSLVTATGHILAAIQLTKEEARVYADIPVMMVFNGSGFYSLPPNEDGMIKFGLDDAGYSTESGVPWTKADPEAEAYHDSHSVGWLPRDSLDVVREQVKILYPELALKPITFTRVCWYPDTPDADWVIDFHPQYPSLLLATGGSGHAFKFLPVIGDLIQARLEGHLEPKLVGKWALNRTCEKNDPGRVGMERKPLILSNMATQQELRVAQTA